MFTEDEIKEFEEDDKKRMEAILNSSRLAIENEDIEIEYLKPLVERYNQLLIQLEELEAEKKILQEEILEILPNKEIMIDDYIIRKTRRKKFTISIEEAKKLGAIKTEEKLDTNKLKFLLLAGEKIPHEYTYYLLIKNKY